jgi:outer membrane protein assembly factor BamB
MEADGGRASMRWIQWLGVGLLLFLLTILLTGCGASPVAQNWPGLTVEDDKVFVISGTPQQVYVLNAENGQQMASFVPQGDHRGVVYWSPVTLGDGVAYVGFAEDGAGIAGLYAFDPNTGQELWSVPADSLIIPAPVYEDGTVYFGSSDRNLYAVDVETRTVKPGWPFHAEEEIWASPLVDDNRVFVAAKDHYVYCLDAGSGELLWKREVGGSVAAQPSLSIADDIVYVGAFDGQVHALHAASGEPVEGFEFQAGDWIWSKVVVDDSNLFVTSLDGKLYVLDRSTGAVVSPYPYDSGEVEDIDDLIRAEPVLADERIIIATESGRVISVQNAQRLWVWPGGTPEAAIYTTPILDGETVYVVLMNGNVQTLNAETGVMGWAFRSPGAE